jgi:predicted GNAT family acetyltransferase
MQAPRVEHDVAGRRYTLSVGTTLLSEITYSVSGDTVAFEHTTTPVHHRGHGYAAELTGAALDDVRARGCRLVPACPYTRAYLRRHPDQQDLVAEAEDVRANGDADPQAERAGTGADQATREFAG